MPRRESESSDSFFITPEAYKATEAVEFIAEHLRNEDEYIQVGGLAVWSHNEDCDGLGGVSLMGFDRMEFSQVGGTMTG